MNSLIPLVGETAEGVSSRALLARTQGYVFRVCSVRSSSDTPAAGSAAAAVRGDIGRAQSGAADASTDLSACLCPEGGGRHGIPRTCLTSRTYAWAAEIARDDARLPEIASHVQGQRERRLSHAALAQQPAPRACRLGLHSLDSEATAYLPAPRAADSG